MKSKIIESLKSKFVKIPDSGKCVFRNSQKSGKDYHFSRLPPDPETPGEFFQVTGVGKTKYTGTGRLVRQIEQSNFSKEAFVKHFVWS